MNFVPLADDDLPADFRARFGISPTDDPPLPTLEIVNALSLARKEPPSRDWLIYGLIPAREITMLSGDGGTGKSLLALQLAVAMATATEWAGQVPNRGRTMFISAEDDIAELHRRLAAIVRAQSVSIDDLESLDILPLAGRDAVLAAPRDSILKETPLFKALEAKLDELRPDLLILDTLADLFGGDEIKRPHARQFIGMLRGLAIKYGVTILLLSHPSLTGMTSGTGTSGSTAWSNSVRSRLYFERPKGSEGDDDDDRRILTTKKANYGRAGGEVVLRWRDGVFVLASPPPPTNCKRMRLPSGPSLKSSRTSRAQGATSRTRSPVRSPPPCSPGILARRALAQCA